MILAAGRGLRLRPLTDVEPKALTVVAGKPLIEHWLAKLCDAGIREIVINLGWLGEAIRKRLGNDGGLGLSIQYSDEGWPALETGGGVYRALPLLGPDAFVVINADVFAQIRLESLIARAAGLARSDLAHLLLVPTPAYRANGDFGLEAGRIVNLPRTLTFSGISLMRPELFSNCSPGAFSVVPLLRASADQGRIGGSLIEGSWNDVGTPERLQELNALLRPV